MTILGIPARNPTFILTIFEVIIFSSGHICRTFKKNPKAFFLNVCFEKSCNVYNIFCLSEQLLEFMHQLPAFANMTMSVRRELCAVMVFAVVERAGTIVLNDGEEVSEHCHHLKSFCFEGLSTVCC